jgi:hypothetical protein
LRVEDNMAPGDNEMGLWRDSESLVVNLSRTDFPPRCLKTNESIEGSFTHLEVHWIPAHGMWLLVFGLIGHCIAKSLSGRAIPLQVPLSQAWLAKRKLISFMGWLLLLAGLVCPTIAGFVHVATMMPGHENDVPSWFLAALFAGPPLALIGLVVLFKYHKPILIARKVTDDHAWLQGANSAFLESLPAWPY